MTKSREGEAMTPEEKREAWGDGPWVDEPDRVEWRVRGYPCLVRRITTLGHFCGYVAVPPGHPWHGKSYDELEGLVEAHGGVTSAGPCEGEVCHVPEPGEPDDVHWVGFDAAHAFDVVPYMQKLHPDLHKRDRGLASLNVRGLPQTRYRDLAYMRAEVEQLVAQAEAACAVQRKEA